MQEFEFCFRPILCKRDRIALNLRDAAVYLLLYEYGGRIGRDVKLHLGDPISRWYTYLSNTAIRCKLIVISGEIGKCAID